MESIMNFITGALSSGGWAIGVLIFFLAIIGALRWAASRYKTVPPSKVGIVYGRKHRIQVPDGSGGTRTEEVGFQILTGGGKVIYPIVERYDELSLLARQIELAVEDVPTKEGVKVGAKAAATVAVGSEQANIIAAVRNFQGMSDQEINRMINQIMEGQLRGILGTMTIEELNQDREKLNTQVLQGAETELAKIGIKIQIFTIQQIWDKDGYIDALGRGKTAEVIRDAKMREAQAKKEGEVAESNAQREAEVAKATNEAQIADAKKKRDLQIAKNKAEVDRENAIAALAGQLATAENEKELKQKQVQVETTETEARTALAVKAAERREQELIAEVLKPAEAKRQAASIEAEGIKAAAIIKANQEKEAKVIGANADKEAAVLSAEATRTSATAEAEAARQRGKGAADALQAQKEAEAAGLQAQKKAEAAGQEALLLAQAKGTEAQKKAEAEGQKAALLAEAEGLERKLVAEATGKRQLAEALAKLDATGRLLQVLDAAPRVAEAFGDALAKALGPEGASNMFGQAAQHLASVDSIKILDMGGSGDGKGGGLMKYANLGPDFVFNMIARAQALGINLPEALGKFGISSDLVNEFLSGLTHQAPKPETPAEGANS